MDEKSEGGRENGGGNDTNDTKEEENTRAADSGDTENGVVQNVDDDIKKEDPEAEPGRKTSSEEQSEKVPSESDGAQTKVEFQLPENASGVETTAGEEVKELDDEAQIDTKDNNILQGKTNKTNASNSEKQPNPDCSQADPGIDQVETSRTVQYQDGVAPQTAADSSPELATNKAITEPSNKTPDAPTAQSIIRNNMEDSTSNGTQEAVPSSGSGKTDTKESGEPPKADPPTAPHEGSVNTNGEESGESKIADHSSARHEGPEKTEAGLDPHAGGALEIRVSEQKVSKEGAAATDDGTKQDGTTKQKANEEQVEAGSTEHLAEKTEEPFVHINKKQGLVSFRPSNTTANPSQLVMKEILTDKILLSLSKQMNLKNVPAESLSIYLGFRAADGAAAVIGANSTMNPQSALNTLLSKFVMKNGRNSDSALNLRKRFLDNGMKDSADVIKAELDKFPVPSDEEALVDTPVIISSSFGRPGLRNPTTNLTPADQNSGSKDPKDKEGARERKTKEKSEEEKRATENKANEQKDSKEGAAAIIKCTKGDETTKQRVDEKKVEHIIKKRPVSISVCTSAYEFNVQGLVSFLKDLKKHHPELIKEVKVHALPYNDLDHYKFTEENPVDVMLLCHSINNRRFAITDVMDALYDVYLPYCARVIGKNKMGVIVHDFDDMNEAVQSSRMGSFSYKQPKAFETTSLQIICGQIEKKEQVLKQMQTTDREKLLEFLKNASTFPEEMIEGMNADQGFFKVATKYVTKKASSSYSSLQGLIPTTGWRQDSTSEGSSVDPSGSYRNDHGTTHNATAQDDKTKRWANESQPSSQPTKRACLTKKATFGGTHQTHQACVDERNLNPPREASFIGQQSPRTSIATAHTQGAPGQQSKAAGRNVTSAPQRSSSRRISISVCSSAYEHNVKGFMTELTELQTRQKHMIADVRFRSLPYNDIDSFRFPSNDPVDVMVLCHSVQNRGFSITNVTNALYEKYLQYCHGVLGKKKLAVIVHDFSDCKPKTLEVRMESFRRSQPLTFELVDTVFVCGSLEKPGKIEIRDEDMTKLIIFFERARFEPKDDQSSWQRSVVNWFSRKNSTDK